MLLASAQKKKINPALRPSPRPRTRRGGGKGDHAPPPSQKKRKGRGGRHRPPSHSIRREKDLHRNCCEEKKKGRLCIHCLTRENFPALQGRGSRTNWGRAGPGKGGKRKKGVACPPLAEEKRGKERGHNDTKFLTIPRVVTGSCSREERKGSLSKLPDAIDAEKKRGSCFVLPYRFAQSYQINTIGGEESVTAVKGGGKGRGTFFLMRQMTSKCR